MEETGALLIGKTTVETREMIASEAMVHHLLWYKTIVFSSYPYLDINRRCIDGSAKNRLMHGCIDKCIGRKIYG